MPTNRLAQLRREQGLSQAAFAQDFGVTPSTIWRWENGRVAIPDQQKIALALRFKVTVAHLMGWPESSAA